MAALTQAQKQAQAAQQNMAARANLLQTALPIRKKVATITGLALGQTFRQRLLNVGLTHTVKLKVTASIDITAAMTTSPVSGPYGLLQKVSLVDYNQIERVSASCAEIAKIGTYKAARQTDSYATPLNIGATDQTTEIAELGHYPTAIASPVELSFFLDVPFAVDPAGGDLRGLSLSQAVVGEQFVEFTVASALVNADPRLAPYIAGTATVVSIQVEVWQEYYQPASNAALPLLDLATVYELKGLLNSAADIATNGQKLINYPNVRTVMSCLNSLVDNSAAMTSAGLTDLQLLVNSAQILQEHSYSSKRREMHQIMRGLPWAGDIYMDHRRQPISTAIFGNVQLALNWGTITGGTTYVQTAFESLYMAGTPLPGVSTQG